LQLPTTSTKWGITIEGNKAEGKYEALPGSWSTVFKANSVIASLITNRAGGVAGYYHVVKNIVLDGDNKAVLGYENGYQDTLLDSSIIQCTGAGISLGELTNATVIDRVSSILNGEGFNYISAQPSGVFVYNSKFRQNTGNGATISSGIQAHFINTIFESNGGTGTSIIGAATPLQGVFFDSCHWENNTGYQIYITKTGATVPAQIRFTNPLILPGASDDGVQIVYGSAEFVNPIFQGFSGGPATAAGYFNVASTAGTVLLESTETILSPSNLTIDGTGAANVQKYYTKASGANPIGFGFSHVVQANVLKTQVDAPTARALTGKEVAGTIVTNYGQAAANVLLDLPTANDGYSFTAVIATVQGANYWGFQGAGGASVIYLNGSATPQAPDRKEPTDRLISFQVVARG